jgi:hypothetical protein
MDPIKEYIDIGIFLAILIGIGVFAHHEREVEKTELQAAQTASDLKETQRVAQVNANASASINALQTQLSAALANHPKPAVTVRMCVRAPAAGSSATPSTSAGSSGNATLGPDSAVGSGDQGITEAGPVDTAPFTESILTHDKAVIDYLQGYVRACQTSGGCAK